MTKPNIAVFGAGLIGKRHIEQAVAQATLAAIVDPSDTAKHMAAEMNVAYFADPDDFFTSPHGARVTDQR